jgi:hypothetical protein
MPFSDIDPYWLIEHASVDDLLALINASEDVRALCTSSTMPVRSDEGEEQREVHAAATGSTMPVRDDEVELVTRSPIGAGGTEPVPKRSETVVLADVQKAQ